MFVSPQITSTLTVFDHFTAEASFPARNPTTKKMASPKRRGSNPLVRLFSGSSPSSSREDLGLTKTTLRLVPAASAPPIMGGSPLTSANPGARPNTPPTSFAVFQTKMLTLEYDEAHPSRDDELRPTRVAYAPVKLPRPPIPRIKITEPDNIPFKLKEEDILPEWRDPPPQVVRRRTFEEDLENARKVWRRSTGLSFIQGEPEILDTRKITEEELGGGGEMLGCNEEFRIGEAEVLSTSARRKEAPSFTPVEPDVLRARKLADDELHVETQRMPETPPDSPKNYLMYDADAHRSIGQASFSCYSPIDSGEGMLQASGLVRKRTIPRSASSAARHARKDSLTRSPSVRSRKRSGSIASQGSAREQEVGSGSQMRRISTDGSAGLADYEGINDPRLRVVDPSGQLPTPPIPPPTPTVPAEDSQNMVVSELKNRYNMAVGMQYSPIGVNPYSDEKSPSTASPTSSYQYPLYSSRPYDPEVESVLSDVSSLTESVASLSSFSASSGSIPSRSVSLSSPTRRSSMITRRGSVGSGSIVEESGQYQEIGGYPTTGRGVWYSNGDYYYQQYQVQELHDIGILYGGKQPKIDSSRMDERVDNQRLAKIMEVDMDVKRIYSPEIDAKRRSREVIRKALPQSPTSILKQPPTVQETLEEVSSPTYSVDDNQPYAEHIEGEHEGREEVIEGEEAEDEEQEEEDEQAKARLRRMREIANQLQQQAEERKAREREMQRAAKAAGNSRVNVIKRKPVMHMAAATGGVV
ncbi:hypothetical protein EV426DRAFT_165037 [Tirmania nivea]|nr:hypothetical protein EV426DRAFT_165037 [Tirmania nivea]